MPYDFKVSSDWAPAYELVVSLATYSEFSRGGRLTRADFNKAGRLPELGPEWVADVKRRGGRALQDAIDAFAACEMGFEGTILLLLAWLAPEPRTADAFLDWLEQLPAERIFELLSSHIDNMALSETIEARQPSINLLRLWNRVYFSHVDQKILTGLADSAQATAARLAAATDPADVVEEVTNGVFPEPGAVPRQIILVPQYHFRPGNITGSARNVTGLFYPAEVLPADPSQLPPRLKWLTSALNDENRLRILRYLAVTPRRFSDIVQYAGLAKSTVHHHLLLLRAAGLIRVHDAGRGPDRYSLRTAAIESIGPRLLEFVRGEDEQ